MCMYFLCITIKNSYDIVEVSALITSIITLISFIWLICSQKETTKQIKILNEILESNKSILEHSKSESEQEKKVDKNRYKPNFKFSIQKTYSTFEIWLQNFGEEAILFDVPSNNILQLMPYFTKDYRIDKNKYIQVANFCIPNPSETKMNEFENHMKYELKFKFSDKVGNLYETILNGTGIYLSDQMNDLNQIIS